MDFETGTPQAKKSRYHHGDLRAELLKAAEAILSEKGIESFSLRAVAKRAGVSHGAPSHHFSDVQGLLTALAGIGFQRFVRTQIDRQSTAKTDPISQLAASGLGYIDFAMANPALFRLMFNSEQPDHCDQHLAFDAFSAFNKLVVDVKNVRNIDPYSDPVVMKDVMSAWAIVHGLANLMISNRAETAMDFERMSRTDRDTELSNIILRAIGLSAPT